ncbi:AAA family ATPase [Paracoccus rhizosphaerae]|uniref:AAA family ATPase n=1 Tax=Paracoccus rhizosphaerae TaxID=1133347 RepID=A0ABV6CEC8_9RHOB|nr:AAA family ATPase [Paracoccus rhizosphaerae]
MTAVPDPLEALAARLAPLSHGPERRLVALVGPPGAGKSHVADRLAQAIPKAAILQMDGFHIDDTLLAARGDLPRKGAPHTFDLDGLAFILDRLAADDGRDILIPVFDRARELSRAAAREIPASARLVIVEGNYLLLDRPGWRNLTPRFALSIMLQVPDSVIRARLTARWSHLPADEARAKLEANDLPNAQLVTTASLSADIVIPNG